MDAWQQNQKKKHEHKCGKNTASNKSGLRGTKCPWHFLLTMPSCPCKELELPRTGEGLGTLLQPAHSQPLYPHSAENASP